MKSCCFLFCVPLFFFFPYFFSPRTLIEYGPKGQGIRTSAYEGVRNVTFLENFAYVLNERPLREFPSEPKNVNLFYYKKSNKYYIQY